MSNINRFKPEDYQSIINNELEQSEELKKAYLEAEVDYELKKIGKELAAYRKEHNIQQGSISDQTHLTQQMISRIENMNPKPSMETFMKYLYGMGLKIKFESVSNDEKSYTGESDNEIYA